MFAVSQMNPDEKYAIISLITVGFGMHEVAVMGGFAFVLLDIAPDFVGILQGINNTIGLTPGFIIPAVVSALTPDVSYFKRKLFLLDIRKMNENDFSF